MRAFICDVCKEFFKPRTFSEDEPCIKTRDGYLDLCDECQKKLENFIKVGEFK